MSSVGRCPRSTGAVAPVGRGQLRPTICALLFAAADRRVRYISIRNSVYIVRLCRKKSWCVRLYALPWPVGRAETFRLKPGAEKCSENFFVLVRH